MTTLQRAIETVTTANDKAFIPYIMAGDGGLDTIKQQILFLQQHGATAIEVGIPFSDPVADGPTIQAAGLRALEAGANLRTILAEIASFKEEIHIPLVVMTYLNPIIRYGIEAFVEAAEAANIKGLIVPDMPLEEADMLTDALAGHDIALVQLISLTSPTERIEKLAAAAQGFIYAVTVNGITGTREGFDEALHEHLSALKSVADIPVLAGFGISTREHVEAMNHSVDGVIVGSAIVKAFHENRLAAIEALLTVPANQ
ncbi:tryptophan synthase subunit alpha [Kurthia huakuii]|uniref:tryptophan synthase subunit alpha n=1 Tax=Kurthia huakuii TaxID=1421019 RepID=UPI0004952E67|nr:tryptophan synthase subunit alpha [Kurthia huakuii]MBM7699399.1 tryptophan synthase alpha chain [Kurthia huakuii]